MRRTEKYAAVTRDEVNAADGRFPTASKLFDADLSDLNEIRFAIENLSNSILHKGGHSILDGLLSQILHFGPALYQSLHVISSHKEFMNASSAPVSGVSAIGASVGFVEEQVIVIGDSQDVKIPFISPDDVIKFLFVWVILLLAVLAEGPYQSLDQYT